jgi:hypothetical protein
MGDYWTENAVKVQAVAAAGVERGAVDEAIIANAGGRFGVMGANEPSSVITAMRNLTSSRSDPRENYCATTSEQTRRTCRSSRVVCAELLDPMPTKGR